jgi:hypothetical protein
MVFAEALARKRLRFAFPNGLLIRLDTARIILEAIENLLVHHISYRRIRTFAFRNGAHGNTMIRNHTDQPIIFCNREKPTFDLLHRSSRISDWLRRRGDPDVFAHPGLYVHCDFSFSLRHNLRVRLLVPNGWPSLGEAANDHGTCTHASSAWQSFGSRFTVAFQDIGVVAVMPRRNFSALGPQAAARTGNE